MIAILFDVLHHPLPCQRRNLLLHVAGGPVHFTLDSLHLHRGQFRGTVAGPAFAKIPGVVPVNKHAFDVGKLSRVAEQAESGARRGAKPAPEILHTAQVHVARHSNPHHAEDSDIALILRRQHAHDDIAALDAGRLDVIHANAVTQRSRGSCCRLRMQPHAWNDREERCAAQPCERVQELHCGVRYGLPVSVYNPDQRRYPYAARRSNVRLSRRGLPNFS